MPDPKDLIAALERLIAGTASDADRKAVSIALTTGVLVTGDRAAAIGGNASDVIITSGDGNTFFSFSGSDAAALREALSSTTPPRLHQMPPPPADFTGRADEQRELLAAIEQGGVTISGLRGLGGIGKTALALKLAEQLKPRYPDAQFYLDLKGASAQPLTSAEALAHVIRAYLPAAKLPENEIELRDLYLSVLHGQRALILMDNAAGAEQVEPLIPPSGCVLLVTSRRLFTLPGLVAKNLDTLSAIEARTLLLAIAPRIGAWADEIAALCGQLPLALRLAASSLANHPNLKPEVYVERLQDQQLRLKLIDASLSLSYELLSEELKERWRLLAVFPESFADDAAAAVWAVEVDDAQQGLGELIAASMVDWNETTNRYVLHDLARVFADSKLGAAERADGKKRHATHFMDVLSVLDDLYLEGGVALKNGLAGFDLEWANIQAGQSWVAAQDVEVDTDVAHLCMSYPNQGPHLLGLRRHARERIRWLDIALTEARRWGNRELEGVTLVNLGLAYQDLGETKRAIQIYEQTLIIVRQIGNRRVEGVTLGNIGIAYTNLGEPRRAIEVFEQLLVIARDLPDRRIEGNTLNSLGVAYWTLKEIERAIEYFEQRLVIAREMGDRRGEGSALTNLGLAYTDQDETQRAIEFYEQALLIDRELGDHRGEGFDLWNISLVLNQLGQRAEAIQHAEESLVILEQLEDPNAQKVRAALEVWRKESGHD